MEILTSMTFWIVIVVIIVLLAIVGYVAEGTILADKKQEKEKNEKKEEKEALSAWTEDASAKDDRQEKVYNTADQSWLDMPDVASATETLEPKTDTLEPKKEIIPEVSVTPMSESIGTAPMPSTPQENSSLPTGTPVSKENNNPEMAASSIKEVSTLSEPAKNEPSPIATVQEKTPISSQQANTVKPEDKGKEPETLDIWTN